MKATEEKQVIAPAHWTEGGTGLTNFHPSDLPLYERAVREHGDESFFIVHAPIAGEYLRGCRLDYYSLHLREGNNASSFWATFRRVKQDAEAEGKA